MFLAPGEACPNWWSIILPT